MTSQLAVRVPDTGASWPAWRSWWEAHRGRTDDVLLLAVLVVGAVVIAAVDDGTGVVSGRWGRVALTLTIGVGLLFRRRFPFALALLAAAAVALGASELALPATLLTLALRRHDKRVVLAGAAAAGGYLFAKWHDPTAPDLAGAAIAAVTNAVVFVGLPLAVGGYLSTRRQLERQLRGRAERAEREQLLRAEQTRLSERTHIAREMHDVLAHRISLVAMHAGALEVNPGLAPDEVARSAVLIRSTAHQALEDLRRVLGVLRTAADQDSLQPQPDLGDVERLIAASVAAGMDIRLEHRLPRDESVPLLLARTAYHVVQEGLTNAAKHAPGAPATVHLSQLGSALGVMVVEVRNGPPAGPARCTPGSGLGLVGLRERVELAGGSLTAGPAAGGGFRLHVELPARTEDRSAT